MSASQNKRVAKLAPDVNRILFVRNLPYKLTSTELYDIFGKYGAIRQIRVGDKTDTKGTAFIVYEDIYDAKNAVDHLSGFNVCGRYLVVLYYQAGKKRTTEAGNAQLQLRKQEEVKRLRVAVDVLDAEKE
jgi:pre-mRNA branch site protein p14